MPKAKPERKSSVDKTLPLHKTAESRINDLGSAKNVTIHQAKTHLSQLLKAVEAGDTVVIARGTTPIARLVPFEPPRRRQPGRLKGKISIGPEFFEPLPDEELKAWEGD